MDSPTEGVFLTWWEGLPSEEVGSGRPGEGDLFCLCSSYTIPGLHQDHDPSHSPLGIAWTPDPRNDLIQPGRNHGMTGGIIKTLFCSQSADDTVGVSRIPPLAAALWTPPPS